MARKDGALALLRLAQQGSVLLTQQATGATTALGKGSGMLLQQFRGLAHETRPARKISLIANYKQLSKFKLSSLVVLTAGAGYAAGSGPDMDWAGFMWTSLGTFGAAACANTLNQLYEVANDRMMSRTCNRPLPTGRISRMHAAGFALAAGAAGLTILYHQANPLTAALGAANIVLYAGVYTPLKQVSIINTWVGAVVGAIPPLMGWAAASGQLELGAGVLAAALFSWQMPHFMALAWMCKEDYMRGGFRMLSSVDLTGRRTGMVALRHALFLVPLGWAAYQMGLTSEAFAYEAAGLAAMLAIPSVAFIAQPSQQAARKLFKASLLYLPLAMLGLVAHRLPNDHTLDAAAVQRLVEEQFEGQALEGTLPMMRTGLERTGLAAARVFGLGSSAIQELRCPSTVHAEEVEQAGSGAQPGSEQQQAGQLSEGSAEGADASTQQAQRTWWGWLTGR
uniref:Heme O synthase n=1 Tax=Chlamydomonas leiostraca TaxID=1034604 RepID=A0A7S0S054_9CHLO|mmetsp:Transcript_37012/g.93334  ORF Transcript_37012/g.93334 Transcript_37012/m.93334 type:complete len:452 (+) Transcript_37012:160-1515(+)|eukprot:CAMPEP_0202866714 /NCGR_PEP_ID=MMETSP1391-20130828/8320_1 /ASSEMBLY_ACC=CAM_ASM_000867 /TAXON_ID=1034604 /ORGANISM="Chlamydomonas leiostraca, Strain SAG 11-49" /LENGTH=451 /DNA_ID=CAMNT_0049546691 /DNA_START=152 /DNA_END=1507 /DNA_ORIENTATION=-